ncbi:hypothetical protein CBL_01564 [Carabus blaptoides fortunei]
MKFYTVCVILAIAVAAQANKFEKAKRGAETYVTSAPKAPVRVTYPAQSSYTAQQALAAQQAYNAKYAATPVQYVAPQQHASYVFEAQQAQPGVKYSLAQPDFKYAFAQQSAAKAASAAAGPAKIAYSGPVNVQYAAQPAAAQQHYSPANSVSSFSFSNPHVTYSNLGLLSQVAGKGYTGQQQQLHQQTVSQSAGPQQVAYVAAPAQATHYVSAGGAQQVSHASAQQIQYSAAPQVQYVQAPQVQFAAAAGPQYQISAHQGSHSSPQYVYAAPQVSYAAGAAPTKTHYTTSGVTYA